MVKKEPHIVELQLEQHQEVIPFVRVETTLKGKIEFEDLENYVDKEGHTKEECKENNSNDDGTARMKTKTFLLWLVRARKMKVRTLSLGK